MLRAQCRELMRQKLGIKINMFATIKEGLSESSKSLLSQIFYPNGLLNLEELKAENIIFTPIIHNADPSYLNIYDILTSAINFIDEAVELENGTYNFEDVRYASLELDKTAFIKKMAEVFAGEYLLLCGATRVVVNIRHMDVCILIAPVEKFSLVYGIRAEEAIEQTRDLIYEEMIHAFDIEVAIALLHQAEQLLHAK